MSFVDTLTSLFTPRPTPPATPMARPDAECVGRVVWMYCHRIGCNESNTTAAVSWALRQGGDTLSAIRAGRQRAMQLLERQQRFTPPTFPPRSA
jgi:hypothetical protein